MSQSSPSNDGDDFIGKTIAGRYRIISKLGEGGMGVTYRAWDSRDGIPVVVKIPRREIHSNPEFMGRFSREVKTMLGLSHEHIVPITDHGEEDGYPFVVMRLLPGGSLSNRRLRDAARKPKPMQPASLHSWLPQVAAALDFVHASGVVHRDVKPANIFFDASWGAFLGDFGVAKITENSETFDKELTLTATHMRIGTQEYMPPEQFTTKAVIDGRADQYSLAVMVYEMLTGVRPFTGETAHLIVEVTTRPVPPLQAKRSDLPASLVSAVHRALAKNPRERFASCQDFAAAVLQDVTRPEEEPDVARLLCPMCSKILKLPTSKAGKKGKCPICGNELIIAQDLGALWLLNEDPAQIGSGGGNSEGRVDIEALEDFKPISDTTPKRKTTSATKRKMPSVMMWGGLAAIILAALVGWSLLPSGNPKDGKQRLADHDEQLIQAEQELDLNPNDKGANEFLGKHWCFYKQDWPKGLPYLAKGVTAELVALAQQEIDARNAQPVDAGKLITLAQQWWEFPKRNRQSSEPLLSSMKKHAADMYLQHIGAITSGLDTVFANGWLDSDDEFRELVGDVRPAAGESPVVIADKTLVAWVRLHNLDQRGGSALTLENNRDVFDAIVFGERSPRRWYVGSEWAHRSNPQPDAVPLETDAVNRSVCMATVYADNKVTMYRDGNLYSEHAIAEPFQFKQKECTAIFGLRHSAAGDRACIAADIDDARIYNVALSPDEISALKPNVLSGRTPIAWWTFNEGSIDDFYGCFPNATVVNAEIRDGRLTLNGANSYATFRAIEAKPDVAKKVKSPQESWPPADAVVCADTRHAYKTFREILPWSSAKERCESMGGHLVTISSAEEQAIVLECIRQSGIQVDRRDGQPTAWEDKLWAGGTDQGTDGVWRWIDGSAWKFSAWVLNQPGKDGDFLNICPHIGGEWNDEGFASEPPPPRMAGFICEWEPRNRLSGLSLPDTTVVFEDRRYWFSSDKKNQGDAHKAALAMGGQLLVINNEQENEFVAKHVKGRTWLGIRKVVRAWLQMSDNSKATFATWAKGQPSGFHGEVAASTAGNKEWHDHFATDKLFYCVEWPATALIKDQSAEKTVTSHADEPNLAGKTIDALPMEDVQATVAPVAPQPVAIDESAARENLPLDWFRRRSGDFRDECVAKNGGGIETETAVGMALEWLVRNQEKSGLWSLRGPYLDGVGRRPENRLAATAMALLALQGAGNTTQEGPHRAAVHKAWKALLPLQRDGGTFDLGQIPDQHAMYAHAQVTIALCELYGMTRDADLRAATQQAIDYAVAGQMPDGGWKYHPPRPNHPNRGDMSVTAWYMMALKSGEMAGLDIPREAYERLTAFLDAVFISDRLGYGYEVIRPPRLEVRAALTAEALLCRQFLGWQRDDPRLRTGVDLLFREVPRDFDYPDVYTWYYVTQVCHHLGGDPWREWNAWMRATLPAAQVVKGKEKGSWNPAHDKWGYSGGRLFMTCMCTCMLEVYYRHLPLFSAVE